MTEYTNGFEPNDQFCAVCGTILPLPAKAPCEIQCVLCKSTSLVKEQIGRLVNCQERSYVRTVADTDEAALTHQDEAVQVEHICPKCGHHLASYMTQQTRSADEGQTVFYTCLKCKNRSIEYS
ncbi:transcription factor s-II (TFIIS) domain-containing protein [Ditylenchus destructor]|nr:transcription factor s-II (TFIIS) domain-containing protein [Ditylenchus destructor]